MNPTIGWQRLQDVYYCLRPCYEDLLWPLKDIHSNHSIRLLSEATLVAVASAKVAHPSLIDIYTAAGLRVAAVAYNSTSSDYIAGFAFHKENLVVVLSSGSFRYYHDFDGNFSEHDFNENVVALTGNDSVESHDIQSSANQPTYITNLETQELEMVSEILLVDIFENFLVLRLQSSFQVINLSSFQNYLISNLPFHDFHCFNILSVGNLDDNKTTDEKLSLLIASNSTISVLELDFLAHLYTHTDQGLTDGPFKLVCASPNGRFVALYNPLASKIFVINAQFDQVLLEYDTATEVPFSVAWCGNDAIILLLRDEFRLIGPGQQLISFFYDSPDLSLIIPLLHTRVDGLTVVTELKIEFLGRVPECSIRLYAPGLASPGSILLDCVDKLAQHLPKADTNISLLKTDESLDTAIAECLESALVELSTVWQKKILKAVLFGKIYVDSQYDASEYLKTVLTLQVLNQLRSMEVGLFLTHDQLVHVGWDEVTDMLLHRNLHYLAVKILDLVGEQPLIERVYLHWCCSKIQKELNMSDSELFLIIAAKIEGKLLPLLEISAVALQEGRVNLCRMLVNLEPLISRKISSFAKLGDLELALISAFQSGDYDLCKLILLYLFKTLSILQFYKVLNQNELSNILSDTSVDLIKGSNNLFVHGDLIANVWSSIRSSEAITSSSLEGDDGNIDISLPTFKEGDDIDDFYKTYKAKVNALIVSLSKLNTKEYQTEIQLLELKKKLQETYHEESFFDKTLVVDVIIKLLEMNQIKPASKVSKEHNVSLEKFWYLVLNVLSKNSEFERLHTFILGNREDKIYSPIGFKPIIERCLATGAPKKNISVYISNCSNLHYLEIVEYYVRNGDYIEASAEAMRHKDVDSLTSMLSVASGTDAQVIREHLQKLGRL